MFSFVLAGSRWSGPSRGGRHSTTGYNRSILQTHTDRPSLCDGEGHLIVQCLDDEGKDGGGKKYIRSIDTVTGQLRVVDQGTKSGWAVGENSSGYNRYLY